MSVYISREAAVTIADYAADEYPYDKDPKKPETSSDYNQGWNDACDYIRGKLEEEKPADVEPVRHGRWEGYSHSRYCGIDADGEPIFRDGVVYYCSNPKCRRKTVVKEKFCPSCGTKMNLEEDSFEV